MNGLPDQSTTPSGEPAKSLSGGVNRSVNERLNILQVSTADRGGGAEKVAWDLFRAYSEYGHESWLAVGTKKTDDPQVLCLNNDAYRSAWTRFWLSLRQQHDNASLLDRLEWIGEPSRKLKIRQGLEDFEYPATWQLLSLIPQRPDVIHCHNLHTSYFDLRALSDLSRQVPVVLTVHDEWLLSGHCAYTLGCKRWKTGCGECPDLNVYPAIGRDATAYNWRRKRKIFAGSRIYVSSPCRSLLEEVGQSILAPAVVESRLIPYGVDLSVFHPRNRRAARAELGIPEGAKVLLFTANGVRRNPFKDYEMIRSAVAQLSDRLQDVLFIALGEDSPAEPMGRAQVRFVPYEADVGAVASYFQAADVYLHASKADTFPKAILEALACGTPVVATAVGGIPEQIRGLHDSAGSVLKWNRFDSSEATGILVQCGDSKAMTIAIERLIKDESLRLALGNNAARDARRRFDLKREAMAYLDWYEQVVERTRAEVNSQT